ncbi:hypothetical protein [Haladaptatus sp. NG-WS-4]
MTDTYEFALYHEDADVAAAIGDLLNGDSSVDDVVSQYGVTPEIVTEAIVTLGITEHIAADLPDTVADDQQRNRPAFFDDRDSITRQRRGIRDDSAIDTLSDTSEISFTRALLSEASQRAREQVLQHITDKLGSDAAQLRVTVRSVPTNREYPDHIRWISVEYPIDDSDHTKPAKVQSPTFPFARLEEILPRTIDVTVDFADETFTVRNIPVVANKEYWQ